MATALKFSTQIEIQYLTILPISKPRQVASPEAHLCQFSWCSRFEQDGSPKLALAILFVHVWYDILDDLACFSRKFSTWSTLCSLSLR